MNGVPGVSISAARGSRFRPRGLVLVAQTVRVLGEQVEETASRLPALVPLTRTGRSLSGWVARAEFVDIHTLGDITVRRERGGFRQDSQAASATSNVNGTVTRARPSP